MAEPVIATYRLQLHRGFDLHAAASVVDYLADLGISDIYCSPIFQAVPGSQHGYDVVDPTAISDDLGGRAAYAHFLDSLQRHRRGHMLDIVPNHMATHSDANTWWRDLLTHGLDSRWARVFDLAWHDGGPPQSTGFVLPELGQHLNEALEAGAVRLVRTPWAIVVTYGDRTYPVSPSSLVAWLSQATKTSPGSPLARLATLLLPPSRVSDGARSAVEANGSPDPQDDLSAALASPARWDAIDAVLDQVNDDHDALAGLLDEQFYQLACWRVAEQRLDYRRFFDVDGLVGVRVDDDHVFTVTHALLAELVTSPRVTGLRVDHPDGLRDPAGYCRRLAQLAPTQRIYVEKILARDESLRADWPVSGTTGYDFMNLVGGLFVDPAGEAGLDQLYRDFTGHQASWAAVERDAKLHVLEHVLGADVNRLSAIARRICDAHERYRACTNRDIRAAVTALAARLPVYRTYAQAERGRIDPADARLITAATESTAAECPAIDPLALELVREVVLLRLTGPLEADFVMRFQQLTGPVAAKGVEDTAFYRYLRLVSLNEVGGNPGAFGVSVEQFHTWCETTQARWPATLLATATHDHKRGEDARLRIAMLSEMPVAWAATLERWSALSTPHWPSGWRDRSIDYLLYQTLVGAWPISLDRVLTYLRKAMREAKRQTSWTRPNAEYEAAIESYLAKVMQDTAFTSEVAGFVDRLVLPARISSLSQTLLKLTAPGVPDIYQGCELWDYSLVDPDNRSPIDYDRRRALLREVWSLPSEEIWARHDDGLPKLATIARALQVRRRAPAAFGPTGSYRRLVVAGQHQRSIVGYLRGGVVAVVVPRLAWRLPTDWANTTVALGDGPWQNVLTDECLPGGVQAVGDLFRRFPVAMLTRGQASDR
jgi:(1->4)-alpha-D-glucan 1-alpha-D-glucosylmutase